MKTPENQNNYVLNPQETFQLLKEFNIEATTSSPASLGWDLSRAFQSAARAERDKLTHNGLFHNSGNREAFIERVIDRLGKKNVYQYQYSFCDQTEIRVPLDGNELRLVIKEDGIEIPLGYGPNFQLGLHSKFYDELIHFLFDEDSGFYKLFARYKQLEKSINHYASICEELSKPENFRKAQSDKNYYDEFRNRYCRTFDALKPLTEYLLPFEWNAFFRKLTIEPAVSEISSILNTIYRKPEKAISKKRSYEKAVAILESADALCLLSAEERKLIVPWNEFISSIVNTNAEDFSGENGYMSMVKSTFNRKLEACQASPTSYMKKKKSKMEADIRFCQQLKAEHGIDCFIDRSQFSSVVDHFNVVTADNQVWIFRIPRAEPSVEECVRYINVVKALDAIAEMVGKKVKLESAVRRCADQSFHIAPGINKAVARPIAN